MESATGQKAPLHRRFDEKKAIRYISNRYVGLKQDIADQVRALQADTAIIKKFSAYYDLGYKDWVILSAIFNCMINWKRAELSGPMKMPGSENDVIEEKERIKATRNLLKGKVYPPSWFKTSDMDFQMRLNGMIVLKTYGFQARGGHKPENIERFLRDRMKHYTFDLPHVPLFSNPPGDWPEV